MWGARSWVVRVMLSGRGRAGRAEADLGSFALRGGSDFEEFALFEAEHAGEDVGGELQDFRVQVADDGVVIAAGVLHGVFDLREGVLKGSEAFDGAQLRIGLRKREEAFQGAGEHVFGLGLVGGAGGTHGAIAGVDYSFEGALFVASVALYGFDEVGDQVVAALELDVNVGPGVVALDFQAHQAVVHADADEHQQDKDDENNYACHRPTSQSGDLDDCDTTNIRVGPRGVKQLGRADLHSRGGAGTVSLDWPGNSCSALAEATVLRRRPFLPGRAFLLFPERGPDLCGGPDPAGKSPQRGQRRCLLPHSGGEQKARRPDLPAP